MDLQGLIDVARSPGGAGAIRPAEPQPFVIPTLTEQSRGDSAIVLISAHAAVGKSTFARWLAHQTHGHFIDLSSLHVGSHGFIGNLASNNIKVEFDNGTQTVVIDSLDEGLIRSGFENYEAFFMDIAERVSSVRHNWSAKDSRVIVLGRDEAIQLTRMILDGSSLAYTEYSLDYLDRTQATEMALLYANASEGSPGHTAIEAFFRAAARALQLDEDELWQSTLGRGFAGYPPVLQAVAELISSNPAEVLSQWDKPTEWRSAWELLSKTAIELLQRERSKLLQSLSTAMPEGAYGPQHQLDLLASRLRRETLDPCTGFEFPTKDGESEFREAVQVHLTEHPFLAAGSSPVFGSLIAAHAMAKGSSMAGAERELAAYARWPFMWRFFSDQYLQLGSGVIDASDIGWILTSLWIGVDDTSWTTVTQVDGDDLQVEIRSADIEPIRSLLIGELRFRGVLRNVECIVPDARIAVEQLDSTNATLIVMRGGCIIRASECDFNAKELLVEAGAAAVFDLNRTNSALERVTCRPTGGLRVSRTLYRHPWTTSAELVADHFAHGQELSPEIASFLDRVSRRLPGGGLPAFLDGSGRPAVSDDRTAPWPSRDREALGGLIRELASLGVLSKTLRESHGTATVYAYRPEGFTWKDLQSLDPTEDPWNRVDWDRVLSYL